MEIRPLIDADAEAAVHVINEAAEWYAEFLGESHESEMDLDEWRTEARRMQWYGAFQESSLVGVMGLEYVDDVALFRHAYVLPEHQRSGVGQALGAHLEAMVIAVDRIVVGTYRANYKARQILEKGGYSESPDSESVLRRYYDIPEDRLQTSLTYEKHLH